MRATVKSLGIDRLSIEDRILLAEEIWDTIDAEGEDGAAEASDIPDWHKEILDERLAEMDANTDEGVSWEEAKVRILDRRSRPRE
jgi:putative addiction module component (TIGR02574 family)